MDILRNELNRIYEAQNLGDEELPSAQLHEVKMRASAMVEASNACTVITDASSDRCFVYAGAFGRLMGFADDEKTYKEVSSSDEDEIYERLHPEDLVEKRMLEYDFFKMADRMPTEQKMSVKAVCRVRMKDSRGIYRTVENSTQVAALSPEGKMWLIMCCYDLSPYAGNDVGIAPHIVNNGTGEIRSVNFSEQRRHILSKREKEILRLIQQGHPSKQIASVLGISIHTVNRHRQNIIEKLSVGNSVEAVAAATAMKLI